MRVVETLVNFGVDVNSVDRWDGTPLRDAVRHGNERAADELLKHGGSLGFDETTAAGELCELARRGNLDVLKLMLHCGAPVNASDYDAVRGRWNGAAAALRCCCCGL